MLMSSISQLIDTTYWRDICSKRWVIGSVNGSAMRSMRPRARLCAFGFVFEGILTKGRSRDTAFFSMLDREWPARKAQLLALAGAG